VKKYKIKNQEGKKKRKFLVQKSLLPVKFITEIYGWGHLLPKINGKVNI